MDNGILQAVKSKKTSIELTYWIRLILRIFIYVLMTLIVFLIIKGNNGELLFQQYFLESISIGLLLGSIGFFVLAIANNIIYACFSSLGVYLLSWLPNWRTLGISYLFRMGKGLSPMVEFKCIIALVLLVIGLYIKRIQKVW